MSATAREKETSRTVYTVPVKNFNIKQMWVSEYLIFLLKSGRGGREHEKESNEILNLKIVFTHISQK